MNTNAAMQGERKRVRHAVVRMRAMLDALTIALDTHEPIGLDGVQALVLTASEITTHVAASDAYWRSGDAAPPTSTPEDPRARRGALDVRAGDCGARFSHPMCDGATSWLPCSLPGGHEGEHGAAPSTPEGEPADDDAAPVVVLHPTTAPPEVPPLPPATPEEAAQRERIGEALDRRIDDMDPAKWHPGDVVALPLPGSVSWTLLERVERTSWPGWRMTAHGGISWLPDDPSRVPAFRRISRAPEAGTDERRG